MAEGFESDNILRIGFLNEDVEENLEAYKKTFDQIILNDSSMQPVNSLLKEIIS